MAERVFITGGAAFTPLVGVPQVPLGQSMEQNWQATLAGICGLEEIPPYSNRSDVHYAGLLAGFSIDNFISDRKVRERNGRASHLAYAAAKDAIANARLNRAETYSQALGRGVIVGSGIANFLEIFREYEFFKEKGRVGSDTATKVEPEQAANLISQLEFMMGDSLTLSTACASGATAFRKAFENIRNGYADVMIAVGVDCLVYRQVDGSIYHPIALACYDAPRALARGFVESPAKISTPFDTNRRGFVISEAAGAAILESESHAKARGAEIIAEVKGAAGVNGAKNATNPSIQGQVLTMERACLMAGITPDQLIHGNPHGTGTEVGDPVELLSIILVKRGRLDGFYLTGTKAMTGHGVGGTGLKEILDAALATRDGVVPPQPNLERVLTIPDAVIAQIPEDILARCGQPNLRYQEYPLFYREAQRGLSIPYAFSNSFGFGDNNETVVLGSSTLL
ncbi:hypothetical protein HYS93_04790 [Candidatus Daviesbacteria bacterium]|nr:hypothetical protein [Candidatus Daviesbacteria bacterium]